MSGDAARPVTLVIGGVRDDDEDDTQATQGFRVRPITNCPHVAEAALAEVDVGAAAAAATAADAGAPAAAPPCADCGAEGEVLVCLSCEGVHCSRHVAGHGEVHATESGHVLVLSLADMSVWCYACDAYLDTFRLPRLHALFAKYYRAKFGEEPALPAPRGAGAGCE